MNHRICVPRSLYLPVFAVLLVFLLGGFSDAAPLPTHWGGHDEFQMNLYALRGPQEQSAKLYISITSANPQITPPNQIEKVWVNVGGANGKLQSVTKYSDVSAPGGQAVIDLGDVALLDPLSVHILVRGEQAGRIDSLWGKTAVTEFAVDSADVVVPDFEGYGAEMNQNLYTSLSNAAKGWNNTPPEDVADVEVKVKDMRPGLSRIFLSKSNFLPGNQNLQQSFYQTIELAQAAGARVNITWQSLTHPSNKLTTDQAEVYIDQDMQNFAATVNDLIKNHGITAIKELTVQNEPDSVKYIKDNMILYEYAYRQLDLYLKQDGIRSQIKLVGGDLVLNGQAPFFLYMAEHMDDVLDGWSEHIYWSYFDPGYMVTRLNGILADMTTLKDEGLDTKPLSITEYGVRGFKTHNGVAIKDEDPYRNNALVNTAAGYYANSNGTLTPVNEVNVAGFQQAWFNMLAADDGFIGLSKWDLYRAQYDFSYQDFSLIGYLFHPTPGQDRWPLRPAYYMEWLMANTTGQHWQVLGYQGASGTELISPFRDSRGDMTVFALNTDQETASSFAIGDLPAWRPFKVLIWNADGNGKVTNAGFVFSGSTGTVEVNAPAGSLVALTTGPNSWDLCGFHPGPCDVAAPHGPWPSWNQGHK